MKDLDYLEDEEVTVQMGPLIDCVFLLLIFFMVVALTKKSQWEYHGEQEPSLVTAEAEDVLPPGLAITVDARGVLRIAGQEGALDSAALGNYLQAHADEIPDVPVRITTDELATLGMVMPVLDACKQYGLGAFHVRLRRNTSFRP